MCPFLQEAAQGAGPHGVRGLHAVAHAMVGFALAAGFAEVGLAARGQTDKRRAATHRPALLVSCGTELPSC